MTTPTTTHSAVQARKAGWAAFFGTSVEWYDFFIYGTASALVLGKLFFPDASPATGTLLAFATFGVGYVARPVGGIVFGHLGDRIGRKKTLIITLLMMGIVTVCIGLLPTYAQIGIAAPILLVILRLIQGIAVGGEWGGAVLIASEHSAKRNRVAAGAWAQQGAPAGNLLAAAAFLVVGYLPDSDFESWGWRLPFLFSAVLIIIGLVIRTRLEEPKEFTEALAKQKTEKKKAKIPLTEVVTKAPLLIVLAMSAGAVSASFGTFFKVLGLDYAVVNLGVERQGFLLALTLMSAFQFLFQPFAALAANRFAPIRVMIISLIVMFPLLPVAWLLMDTGNITLITIGLIVSLAPICWQYGLLGGFIAEAFPTHIRYTAISLSYQMTTLLFVSIVPLVGGALYVATGSVWSIIGMQLLYGVISLLATIGLWKKSGAGSVPPTEATVQPAVDTSPATRH